MAKTDSDWLMRLQEDIQGRVNMNNKKRMKRNRKRLQPPGAPSARNLYREAIREEIW